MVNVLMAGLGGFAGSICRFLVCQAVPLVVKAPWIPLGTLAANVAGCLAIGVLGGLAEARNLFSPEIRTLLVVGFLGGFTTFSSFGLEIFTMLDQGRIPAAVSTVFLHLTFGILAVWAGVALSRMIP